MSKPRKEVSYAKETVTTGLPNQFTTVMIGGRLRMDVDDIGFNCVEP